MSEIYDVIVVGAGPAGLNASLILARSLRKILVFDHGKPRNWKSENIHGFFSRDGCNPHDLLEIGRQQLLDYGVSLIHHKIVDASLQENFVLWDEKGNTYFTKKLLLTTGLRDEIPKLEGIEEFYGKSIHHCPYCDGYEVRGKALAIYGNGKSGAGLAKLMTNWSDDIIYFSDGKRVTETEVNELLAVGVRVENVKIKRLEGEGGALKKIILKDGHEIPREALFFTTHQYQKSTLAEKLACKFTPKGVVKTDRFQQTNVPGLYVAGDASRDVQLVVVAAAEGAKAAVVIDQALHEERLSGKKVENKYDLGK